MQPKSNVAETLRTYRTRVGLSQEALSERSGISARAISDIERGLRPAPRGTTLALLSEALALSDDERDLLIGARPLESEEPHNNLPSQLTSFVGRAHCIAAVKSLLVNQRLVTLVGSGGVGKSRLALEVATSLLDLYADGVWLIDLGPLTLGHHVANVFASTIGLNDSVERSVIDTLIANLKAKDVLFIVDNCEHVLGECAPLVEAILRSCPRIRILATSRQMFEIDGEAIHRVEPLSIAEAVPLFVERARTVSSTFALTAENTADVIEICRRLDDIPLAIELAAARANVLSPHQLAMHLDERFRVLTGGKRTALPRHQTLHDLIGWSYDLLSETEKRLFARLSVFAGDFSLDAATKVCTGDELGAWEIFETLSSLIDKSLVSTQLRNDIQRYRLLESTRAFAMEKASEAGDMQALKQRHAAYYADFAEAAQARLVTMVPSEAWMQTIDVEIEDIRSALEWAFDRQGDATIGVRLLNALRNFWHERGLAREALRYATMALTSTGDLAEELQGKLWHTIAHMRLTSTSTESYLDAATRAYEILKNFDDRIAVARTLRALAIGNTRLRKWDEAERYFQESLREDQAAGNRSGIVATQISRAVALQRSGRVADGHDLLVEALNMAQALGDEGPVFAGRLNLAESEFALGDIERAYENARANLADPGMAAHILAKATQEGNLAAYAFVLGRESEAHETARHVLEASSKASLSAQLSVLLTLAAITAPSDPARAARLYGYVDATSKKRSYGIGAAETAVLAHLLERLHQHLSDDDIARLQADGALLADDEAVELALSTMTERFEPTARANQPRQV